MKLFDSLKKKKSYLGNYLNVRELSQNKEEQSLVVNSLQLEDNYQFTLETESNDNLQIIQKGYWEILGDYLFLYKQGSISNSLSEDYFKKFKLSKGKLKDLSEQNVRYYQVS